MKPEIIHHVAYHTPFGAIVDIDGVTNPKTGRYHVVQDAIDAGHKSIFVRNGTYPRMGTIATDDIFVMGEGRDALIYADGNQAVLNNGDRVTFFNMSFGQNVGAGGSSALQYSADDGLIHGCWIIDGDGHGIYCQGDRNRIIGNVIEDADVDGIYVEGNNNMVNNNLIKGVAGNAITIPAASENGVYVGNITDTAISDSSGTSTVTGNEQY